MTFIEQGKVFIIPHLSCTPEGKAENNDASRPKYSESTQQSAHKAAISHVVNLETL